MEQGFYHPDRGYWQTTNEPSSDILETYPEGTKRVPIRPVGNFRWSGSRWAELPPDLTALAAAARAQRTALLQQSDWTQVADAPVNQAAWATYRQALRDVPDQAGFPETINWPVAPE